ncbi:MAG TPA: ImmA/IrrE family metallo-endopeptidase [Gaiellaceae bacterium]
MQPQLDNPQPVAPRGVLAMLRALVPRRSVSPWETLLIAELQANRLLEYFEITTAPVPEEVVSELPRIRIVREHGLPMSGCAHWDGRFWVITVNADEHPLRQRFSVMHEFKHVLDHTTSELLYHDRNFQSAHEQAERTADYFAACLLMPKRIVKSLWFHGPQRTTPLAERLQVSPIAARYRLDQLGLVDRASRCPWPPAHFRSQRNRVTVRLQGGRQ